MEAKLFIRSDIMDIHIDILTKYQNTDYIDIRFERGGTIEVLNKQGVLGYIYREMVNKEYTDKGYLWGNKLIKYLFSKQEFRRFMLDQVTK